MAGAPAPPIDTRGARSGPPLPPGTLVGFVVAFLAVIAIGASSYRTLETRTQAAARVTQTMQVVQQLQGVLSTLKDAETGQRGYLLVGEQKYLEPYEGARAALPGQLEQLRAALQQDSVQLERAQQLDRLIEARLQQMQQTVDAERAGRRSEALGYVKTGRSLTMNQQIRAVAAKIADVEQRRLADRQAESADAARLSNLASSGGALLLVVLIFAAAVMTSRDYRARQAEAWIRAGQMHLSVRTSGEQRLEKLGGNVLAFLAAYLGAQVGAIYIVQRDGRLRRFAGHALAPGTGDEIVDKGAGLVGRVAQEDRALHVRDVPPGYLPVASGVGRGAPTELLLAPASVDGEVNAVVELGFFGAVAPHDKELLERAASQIGVAVRSSYDRTRLEELLSETQRQAEELQTQQEELRVSNEELEEQSRVLSESQVRLESQQVELEQTNSQLEEQTQLLEHQKDELAKAEHVLRDRAIELERTNQFKSEFLANMSHELRTPLNSSLILAKLLADNKDGNLTQEQVKFAETIGAAGNDLLDLINDILDLSKIEAGKMELRVARAPTARVVESVVDSLRPQADLKGLALSTMLDEDAPQHLDTDPQRLGQILKNLVGNAIKFTDAGSVTVRVSAPDADRVAFAVRDTGVGVPAHQHRLIFEAFRQADGSTHRKHGGTGLGLAISRDLARLLGGDVSVESAPDRGSTFTLTIPRAIEHAATPASGARATSPVHVARSTDVLPTERAARPAAPLVADDRLALVPGGRTILVIEDDARFATILRDLARESSFQCIVAGSGAEGLEAAATYGPSAIVLDMQLPDDSGLAVLERLKRDPRTRHIPVHVASVTDYTQRAMGLGAVGYALKPVKREELVAALRRLEARFARRLRRVLVVEDDARQRESIRALLANDGVEIVGVDAALDALRELRASTFDCMVLDLSLPDLSGSELLEQMGSSDDLSFPPVIVYTGRTLTGDEEQRLRRFSKSIIIKDARSPERLLDEVTLFLHQVEADLPPEQRRMLRAARDRDTALEGRRILVVEDDVRNVYALTSVLEPTGATVVIARNGLEALATLDRSIAGDERPIDLVLMDIMMPEMDGLTAMRELRRRPSLQKLPVIALTAKAMKDDHERCIAAGANDYIAKPLDVDKLLSLVRVWIAR